MLVCEGYGIGSPAKIELLYAYYFGLVFYIYNTYHPAGIILFH